MILTNDIDYRLDSKLLSIQTAHLVYKLRYLEANLSQYRIHSPLRNKQIIINMKHLRCRSLGGKTLYPQTQQLQMHDINVSIHIVSTWTLLYLHASERLDEYTRRRRYAYYWHLSLPLGSDSLHNKNYHQAFRC